MKTVILAARLARVAHENQVDKQGLDYINHPARVASSVKKFGEIAEAAAWLHDVLEDTHITAEDMAMSGIPDEVIEVVKILTRQKKEETYNEYIDRIVSSGNDVAKIVKLADLTDNLGRPGCPQSMRDDRYLPAYAKLVAGTLPATVPQSATGPAS